MNVKRTLSVLAILAAIVAILGGYFFPAGGESALPLSNPAKIYFTTDDKLKGESGSEIELLSGATLDIQAGATASFAGPLTFGNGSVSAPSGAFTSDLHTGFYRVADHNLGFTAGGTLIADISTTGLDMNNKIVENIGSAGTDFGSTGGLVISPTSAAAIPLFVKAKTGQSTYIIEAKLGAVDQFSIDSDGSMYELQDFDLRGHLADGGAGPLEIPDNISSTGNMTNTGTFKATGLATLDGGIAVDTTNFTVDGATGATHIAAAATVSSTLTTEGAIASRGGLAGTTGLFSGLISANNGINVAHGQPTDLDGTLSCSETAAFSSTVTAEGAIVSRAGIAGTTGAFSGLVSANAGLTTAHGQALTANGTAHISETATYSSTITAEGAITSRTGGIAGTTGTFSGAVAANAGLTVAHGQALLVNGTSTLSETVTLGGLLYSTPISFTAVGAQNLTPASDTYLIDSGSAVSLTMQALTAGKTMVLYIINTTSNRVEIVDTRLMSSDGGVVHINEDDGVILKWANGVYYVIGSFTDS